MIINAIERIGYLTYRRLSEVCSGMMLFTARLATPQTPPPPAHIYPYPSLRGDFFKKGFFPGHLSPFGYPFAFSLAASFLKRSILNAFKRVYLVIFGRFCYTLGKVTHSRFSETFA